MTIKEITSFLENIAPPQLQEQYDNVGLLTGSYDWECTGIITALDATEAVIKEAVVKKCNLIVAHHPIIFGGLKKITGKNYVEKTIINAIKNDIAIYAIHTNLDNVITGVNGKIAEKLGLINREILLPKNDLLKKISYFVPDTHAALVRDAIFAAGAGCIGNYSECSFNTTGECTFKPNEAAQPFIGSINSRHTANEIKIETIYPAWLEQSVVLALKRAHPYEEVAYDIFRLDNLYPQTGSGLVGDLSSELSETDCLQLVKDVFQLSVIRHTGFTGKMVKRVALCGGAGSFLTPLAIASGAQLFITSDVKYHEFFDANDQLLLADIGHYESEQFTIDLLFDILKEKFPTFATLKTGVKTNPVNYFR
jgi:dinuclear metal center YbgI/SA1388 family protein